MTLEITIHDLPPMLNGSNGLKRMHWSKYTKIRNKWQLLIMEQTRERIKGQVRIEFERHSSRCPDLDNLYSSFKVIGDSLKNCGVIEDDNQGIVVSLDAKWVYSKQKEAKTVIRIEKV
jgi:Holliday junction resolvase RusA-like endonuclease